MILLWRRNCGDIIRDRLRRKDGGFVMGRTILCPHCKSALNEDILKQRNSENVCLVCGGSLIVDSDASVESPKEKTKWYYYKEASCIL